MTTLKQVIEASSALLRRWLQGQERQDALQRQPAETAQPRWTETDEQLLERCRKAMKWIDEHRAEYLGQWVALVGDQLIGHGFDDHKVADQAEAAGIETPFMALVQEASLTLDFETGVEMAVFWMFAGVSDHEAFSHLAGKYEIKKPR